MTSFVGFPAGKARFTPLPDLFFTELLPAIDDLAELKLTLFMFWSLNRQRGYPRYLTMAELEAERLLLASLGRSPDGDPLKVLRDAVEKAVARGTLLRLSISDETQQTDYLFLNTPQGRKAVEQVRSGELALETSGYVREASVAAEGPRIFELYEQNIGLLQPLLAEELAEAEQTYPASWIVDAFRIAAERNVRHWRYIKSILERWVREGKDDQSPSWRETNRPGHTSGKRRP
jgi:DnaD/phage-associated family protein